MSNHGGAPPVVLLPLLDHVDHMDLNAPSGPCAKSLVLRGILLESDRLLKRQDLWGGL